MSGDLDERLAKVEPCRDADELFDLGCDLADADRQLDAERCFRRAGELGSAVAEFNLGNTLVLRESWEEAVAAYERALAGGETTAWLNLGNVRQELGDLVGAMDAFREASRVGDTFGTVSLAFCLREQANLDQATAALGEAVDAGNETAVGVLACWEWNRTLDPALEPALRAGADFHPSARADLADLLRSTRRVEEARDVLEQGARLGEVESGCRWATCTPTSWPTTTRR